MKKANIVKNIDQLKKVSISVASVSEATDILNKLDKALDTLDNGLGLAAVQIGIPKRVGLMTKKDGSRVPLINAEIIETEEEFTFIKEGCLSFPDIYLDTRRYRHITIKNNVIDGDKFREETQYYYYEPGQAGSDDLLCIQVQHEIDHFNGIIHRERQIKKTDIATVKHVEKVGRNDKCPCGSGKKYKKCCMP